MSEGTGVPRVHHATRFVLLTVDNSGRSERAELVFYARRVAELSEPSRRFSLAPADFNVLNPNTRACPTFRSQRDAELNLAIYRRTGVLWTEREPDGNPWQLSFMAMLHMANDSALFRTRAELEAAGLRLVENRFEGPGDTWMPLIEAKMVHHFDHRFGTYEGQTTAQENQGKLPELGDAAHADPDKVVLPYYWVKKEEVDKRLGNFNRGWLLGWRRITGTEKQRTIVACAFPLAAVGDSEFLIIPEGPRRNLLHLYANLCSFCFDYLARQKVGGTNASFHILKQLPALSPTAFEAPVD
jgi:hypothetical protein